MKRGYLLIAAILLVAGGVAWNVTHESGAGYDIPVSGYVATVRRDSLGCDSWIPFAAKDCRVIVKIHFRANGTTLDRTFQRVLFHRFLPPPVAPGDPVTGGCTTSGQCRFDQLERSSWLQYWALVCFAGAALLGAWLFLRKGAKSRA